MGCFLMGWIIQSKGSIMGNSVNNDQGKSGTGSAKHGQQDQSQLRQQPAQQNQQGQQAQNKNNSDSTESNRAGNKTGQQNAKGGGQH
jgi:hypothetical protein